MHPSPASELTVLGAEVAERLGLAGVRTELDLEHRCRDYLASLRWPEGVTCPRCSEHVRLLWLASRSKWHCSACRYQFSVTAGTVFHSSHLPVWKWFVAVHLMLAAPEGVSASELERTLGGSYKTAWFTAHRIRAAMRGHGAGLLRSLVDAVGPHARPAVKYRPAYLAERRWRSVHRSNPHVFRDTIRALVEAEGISYDRLVTAC